MSDLSAPAGRLTPVSHAEAVALAGGLQRFIKRGPAVAEDPTVVLISRLLISLPKENSAQAFVQKQHDEVAQLKFQLREEKTQAKGLQYQTEELRKIIQGLQKQNEHLRIVSGNSDKAKIAELEGIIVEQEAEAEKIATAYETVEDGLRKTLTKSVDRAQRNEALIVTLKERASASSDKKDQAKGYLADLRSRVVQAKKVIKAVQFSGKHSRLRAGSRKVSCCPLCQGVSPEYEHSKVGHTKDCAFQRITLALKPTQ